LCSSIPHAVLKNVGLIILPFALVFASGLKMWVIPNRKKGRIPYDPVTENRKLQNIIERITLY